jgi:hypothetical protein
VAGFLGFILPGQSPHMSTASVLGVKQAQQQLLHCSPRHSFFFFFAVLGFELKIYTLSHSTSPFL